MPEPVGYAGLPYMDGIKAGVFTQADADLLYVKKAGDTMTGILAIIMATSPWLLRLNSTDVDSTATLLMQNDARSWFIDVDGASADAFVIRNDSLTALIIAAASGRVSIAGTLATLAGTTPLTLQGGGSGTTDLLRVETVSSFRVATIDSDGFVGIGTPSPDYLLEVEHASVPDITSHYAGAAAAGNKGAFRFLHNRNSDGAAETLAYIQAIAEDNQSKGGLRFVARNNTDVESLRLTSDGNILSGVTALTENFGVAATFRFLELRGSSGAGLYLMSTGATDADSTQIGQVMWIDRHATVGDRTAGRIVVSQSGATAGDRGGHMIISTKSNAGALVDRMQIANDGHVRIGEVAVYGVGTLRIAQTVDGDYTALNLDNSQFGSNPSSTRIHFNMGDQRAIIAAERTAADVGSDLAFYIVRGNAGSPFTPTAIARFSENDAFHPETTGVTELGISTKLWEKLWSQGYEAKTVGDSNSKFSIDSAGKMSWGPGGGAVLDAFLERLGASRVGSSGSIIQGAHLALIDGVTAPATISGIGQIFIDAADGDLKIKYGDGTVKLIVVDT